MANIRITGDLSGLIARLEASRSGVSAKASKVVSDTTDRGVQVGKYEAPVDTGRLEAEIYGTSTFLTGLVVSPTEYARWVNGGTSRQAPNEYMGRTAAIIEPEFRDAIAEAGRPDL